MSDLKSLSNDTVVGSNSATFIVPSPVVPPSGEGLIFYDDFSSGDKSHVQNGFKWRGGGSKNAISTDNPFTGSHSMRFIYGDGNNEQNFSLGGNYNDLYIKFMLYLPDGNEPWGGAAYARRHPESAGSTTNHKLLRLWANHPEEGRGHAGYSKGETVGFSTWPAGHTDGSARAKITADCSAPFGANGSKNYYDGEIFADSDKGKWVDIQMYTRCCTSPTATDAVAKIWKNGVLTTSITDFNNWDKEGDRPRSTRTDGYFFGASNGGWLETTYIFVDNFTVSTDFIQ